MTEPKQHDVDMQGNCSACGGIHFGTGRICVYKQGFPQSPKPVSSESNYREQAVKDEIALVRGWCEGYPDSAVIEALASRVIQQRERVLELEARLVKSSFEARLAKLSEENYAPGV